MEFDHASLPVESVEALRLRLSQLVHSLTLLEMAIAQRGATQAMHSQFQLILTQLTSLASTLALHSESLAQAVAFPLPSFPLATESKLLTTILRKKVLPEVESWQEKAEE
ncbi:hypothetical protein CANCADRAFT_20353, partial [Tortispora caseinolytica NRRL Y-17796]